MAGCIVQHSPVFSCFIVLILSVCAIFMFPWWLCVPLSGSVKQSCSENCFMNKLYHEFDILQNLG